jgi:hypothetical protein
MKACVPIGPLLAIFIFGLAPKASTQSIAGVVNSYYQITAVNISINAVVVDNAAGLSPGEMVLIIQSKGAVIDAGNSAVFGNISAIASAGNYEFNTICAVAGNQVWLKGPFLNTYDPANALQMVAIPAYSSVTIAGTVNSIPWDPATGKGGIVVIHATDTIFLQADVDVSGQGFQGGALVNYPTPAYNCDWNVPVDNYFLPIPASGDFTGGSKGEGVAVYILNEENGRGKQANGGGGGNDANTGGAGGGHYGIGGDGGQRAGESFFDCHGAYPGIGGLSLASYGYSPAVNRIFFGGGGGSGHENNGVGLPGGNGGGIIILSAPVIVGGGGRLLANGISPLNPGNTDPTQAEGDGGGGGGAGGAVILNAPVISGLIPAWAQGANGSNSSNLVNDCTGPGGGGGGGVIWTAGAVFPANVTALLNGGLNGVVSSGSSKASCVGLANGALPGGAGIAQATYTAPVASGGICTTLAATALKYFEGSLANPGSLLSWALYEPENETGVNSFVIERSVDRTQFIDLATLPASRDSASYHFIDPLSLTGTVFYRLEWTDKEGTLSYSPVIAMTRPMDADFGFARLPANPASDPLSIELFSTSGEAAVISIFNAQGQRLLSYPFNLQVGVTSLSIPISGLPAGAYFLVAEAKNRRAVKFFVKAAR